VPSNKHIAAAEQSIERARENEVWVQIPDVDGGGEQKEYEDRAMRLLEFAKAEALVSIAESLHRIDERQRVQRSVA